jgi:hypothetical protein
MKQAAAANRAAWEQVSAKAPGSLAKSGYKSG